MSQEVINVKIEIRNFDNFTKISLDQDIPVYLELERLGLITDHRCFEFIIALDAILLTAINAIDRSLKK